jgi:hypothetical protein
VFSERFAAGKARVKVMPVFDIIFGPLPAEEDFAVATERWKINESAVEVFDLDFTGGELAEDGLDIRDEMDPAVGGRSADILARSQEGSELLVQRAKFGAVLVELIEPLAELGQEGTSLGAGIMFVESCGHGDWRGEG